MNANVIQYADWYDLPATDRFGGDFAILYTSFDAVRERAQPAALLTQTAAEVDLNVAFLILDPHGKVHVAHRLRRFTQGLGPEHAENNTVFATLGDVRRVGVTTIEFAGNRLHRTPEMANVLTAAAIDASIAANPDAMQLAAAAAAEPADDFLSARSRHSMAIPPHLVGPILRAAANGGLSPCDLWTQFTRPLLDDDIRGPMCTPFVDWCRIAYSRGIGADNPVAYPEPRPLPLDDRLAEFRAALLEQDLPARLAVAQPIAPPAEPLAAHQLVAVLGGIRADNAQQAAAAAQRLAQQQAAADLPTKRWGNAVEKLLCLCHVDDENALPEVWLSMAKIGQKGDVTTIQTLLDRAMPELGTSGSEYADAVCSSELAKHLGGLAFQTSDDDKLDTGLSIFSICYPTQESLSKASEAAGLYSDSVQGAAGLTLADNITLKAAQKYLLPTDMMQVKRVCWAYHRLLAVILGIDHPITGVFGEFVASLIHHESKYGAFFSNILTCSSLLRFIQLKMHKWAAYQFSHPAIRHPAPSFITVFDELQSRSWIAPPMPPGCLVPAPPPVFPPPVPANPETPAPPSGNSNTPSAGLFRVQRSLLDADLIDIHCATKRHMDSHGPPPKNDHGKPMCLLFHVRAACKHECPRVSDHHKHSAAESQRLKAYLDLGKAPVSTPTPPAN